MQQSSKHFYDNLADILSKQEACKLLECIDVLHYYCKDKDDIKQVIIKLSDLIIFDYATCVHGNIKNHNSCEVIHVCRIKDAFYAKRVKQIKETAKELLKNFNSKWWKDIDNPYPFERGCLVKGSYESFGLKEGMIYGIRDNHKISGTSFTFIGRHLKNDHRSHTIIQYAVPHLADAFKRICRNGNIKLNKTLTPREIEVLQWLKEGKSSWDISKIMDRSRSVVNFHVKNIVNKMNVVNRTHAVAISVENGLI
jgi:DNA-binding CsgD family transcriptional regulator